MLSRAIQGPRLDLASPFQGPKPGCSGFSGSTGIAQSQFWKQKEPVKVVPGGLHPGGGVSDSAASGPASP